MPIPPPVQGTPIHEMRPALRVAGFEVRTSNPDEMGGAGRIAALWARWNDRRGEAPWVPAIVGVYSDYASDQDGPYTLLVGTVVPKGGDIPSGWSVRDIPAADGLRFESRGPMPAAVFGAWQRIWTHFDGDGPLVRAFSADVEFHRANGVDVHVATRPR
jgi:predicted transcriptional regulator YdeE